MAAVTGRLIADLITRGRTDLLVVIEAFNPARFTAQTSQFDGSPQATDD